MALVLHLQRLVIVAPAAAHVAGDVNVRQEIHLDALQPVALARLAAPAFHVETEAARLVAPLARFRQHRIEIPNRREQARIRGGIRARRAPDGRLIDADHFVHELHALDRRELAGILARPVNLLGQRAIQDLVHQASIFRCRRRPSPRSAGPAESPRRCSSGCARRAPIIASFLPLDGASLGGHRDLHRARKIASGQRRLDFAVISCGVPDATSSPPSRPAPGPRSIT